MPKREGRGAGVNPLPRFPLEKGIEMSKRRKPKERPLEFSRITPDGRILPLTAKQKYELRQLREIAFAWTLRAPRQQAHDRAVKLEIEIGALHGLDALDLRALSLKATRKGIMEAAVLRGWAEKTR